MDIVCHSVFVSREQALDATNKLLDAFEDVYTGLDSEFKKLRSLCGVWESRLSDHFVVVCPEKVFNLVHGEIKTDLSQHLG